MALAAITSHLHPHQTTHCRLRPGVEPVSLSHHPTQSSQTQNWSHLGLWAHPHHPLPSCYLHLLKRFSPLQIQIKFQIPHQFLLPNSTNLTPIQNLSTTTTTTTTTTLSCKKNRNCSLLSHQLKNQQRRAANLCTRATEKEEAASSSLFSPYLSVRIRCNKDVAMGAAVSVGIDIDPHAVTSARQNMVLNEINSNKMSVYLVPSRVRSPSIYERTSKNPDEQASDNLELIGAKQKFDIVIANILLNPLMDLAEDIVTFAKPGAVICLSGILSKQQQQVKELYSQHLENISVSEMDGWACLHGTRKRI